MFVPLSNFHLISFKLILSHLFFGCCCCCFWCCDGRINGLSFVFLLFFIYVWGLLFRIFLFLSPLIIHFMKLHHFQFSSAHIIVISFSSIVQQFLTDIFYHLLLLNYDLFVNGVFSLVLFCFH